MRRLIRFPCDGAMLSGTLDAAPASTGLLIVSGGNEIRIGAHRGMARLARTIADGGWPVLRFDRRGVGDSEGDNHGFASSADDIAAAAAAFRSHHPGLRHLVGFGNCDGATALALFGRQAGFSSLILANPWLVEPAGDLPPPAAIRARYARRLKSLDGWKRLLSGGVDLRRLAGGVRAIAASSSSSSSGLTPQLASALDAFPGSIALILAERDATALAFLDAWRDDRFGALRNRVAVTRIATASHGFARDDDPEKLAAAVRQMLARTDQPPAGA